MYLDTPGEGVVKHLHSFRNLVGLKVSKITQHSVTQFKFAAISGQQGEERRGAGGAGEAARTDLSGGGERAGDARPGGGGEMLPETAEPAGLLLAGSAGWKFNGTFWPENQNQLLH